MTLSNASPTCRRQLTLFVTGPWAGRLDALRQSLDPVQAALIAAHVTLCREDEIERIAPTDLMGRVRSWTQGPLTLTFGDPVRFDGHGILLPCARACDQFQRLRQWLLDPQIARPHTAHITLAHPRNPRSPQNDEAALTACPGALELRLGSVALIEQRGAEHWAQLAQAALGGRDELAG